jgi:hypothetical protein
MKTLFLFLLVGLKPAATDTSKVYVCDSQYAKKYHLTSTCRGLSNCNYRIKKVSVKDAKTTGKTLCKWED